MATPRVLVLSGYGINCELETCHAFELAGGAAERLHVNDLLADPGRLGGFQMVCFPGGFSFGDDTGSGKALAARLRGGLTGELTRFLERDTLVLGICNGFQVMVNLGIVPALTRPLGEVAVALEHNASARYVCRWVTVEVGDSPCVFTRGLTRLRLPVAHGEGRFVAPAEVLSRLEGARQVPLRYATPDGRPARGGFPANPNGSQADVAGLCDPSGRRLGLMPHPERFVRFTQADDWTAHRERARRTGQPLPEEGAGLALFRNAVEYFA